MSIKVLVVEDEEAISHLLKYNLTAEGFEVTVVDDGDDALLVADEAMPDIILLDWMLPNVSGIEICRQLRAREANSCGVATGKSHGGGECGDVWRYRSGPRNDAGNTGRGGSDAWPDGVSPSGSSDQTARASLFA
jgi:hypothetical protein